MSGIISGSQIDKSGVVGAYPAGHVLQADVIDITFQANCNASEAQAGSSITNSSGAQVLSTTLSPVSSSSTFIFQFGLAVDASGSGGIEEAIGLWVGTTLIIDTYWHRRVAGSEPLTHAGAGKYAQTSGDDFAINLRAYCNASHNLSIGRLDGGTTSNTQTGLFYMEVE